MRRIALCAVLLAAVASTQALADKGLYVGAGVGQSYVDFEPGGTLPKIDDNDFAYKIFVGFRAASFFAVEGGYRDFGEVQSGSGAMVQTAETSAFDAEGVGILKLGLIDLFAKLGVVYWDTDVSLSGASFNRNDTSTIYGVGVAVGLGSFDVRLEYEVLDTSVPDDLEMVTFGATWTF